jgi:hypothetical protein
VVLADVLADLSQRKTASVAVGRAAAAPWVVVVILSYIKMARFDILFKKPWLASETRLSFTVQSSDDRLRIISNRCNLRSKASGTNQAVIAKCEVHCVISSISGEGF